MKVLHLIGGGDTGGAKTHVLNLLVDLNKQIDARIICFMRGEFSEEAERMGIPIDVIESGNPFKGVKEIRRLLSNDKIDIIHCHGARGNLMGYLLKRHIRVPMVTTVHSDYKLDYLGRPLAKSTYGLIYSYVLRKSNYYIGVSDPMSEMLIDRNFPAGKIYTIYNGIDFETPIECMEREDFLKSINFKVNEGDVIAGIAARLSPVKDIPTLLKAFSIASKENEKLKLIIAGDGEDSASLKEMANQLGISEKVCFAGWLSDVNSFYNAIDINLLTSISETFPYALTEGVRMRCPTIASRVGGVPVLIDNKVNGLIFEPGDYKELANHLLTLAGDESLRKTYSDLLYTKASKYFSISYMIQTQIDIYNSILVREIRKKAKKRDGIIICGAYGYGNTGDDAILKSIIKSIREDDEYMPITILAKNTDYIKKTFRVNSIYTFDVISMIKEMRKTVIYINGGGSLLQNITSNRSLAYYLFTLSIAKILGNKVNMYGCGIGPVSGEKNIKRMVKVLNKSVDYITLREQRSFDDLKRFGVSKPKMELTCDPALSLKPSPEEETIEQMKKLGLNPDKEYACFMLRTWYDFFERSEYISECADYLHDKYNLEIVFLSLNPIHDEMASKEVARYMKSSSVIINEKMDPGMFISILSHMKICVSMRLHGLIFSSISGTPIIGISYDPKVDAFVDYLGYGQCFNLRDVENSNLLIEAADKAIASAEEKDSNLAITAKLALKEKRNIEAVKSLLE